VVKVQALIRTGVGLHARPAAKVVEEASKYRSRIVIEYGSMRVDAKSILQVLSLGVGENEEIVIRIEGEDEQKAAAGLKRLFSGNLRAEDA